MVAVVAVVMGRVVILGEPREITWVSYSEPGARAKQERGQGCLVHVG